MPYSSLTAPCIMAFVGEGQQVTLPAARNTTRTAAPAREEARLSSARVPDRFIIPEERFVEDSWQVLIPPRSERDGVAGIRRRGHREFDAADTPTYGGCGQFPGRGEGGGGSVAMAVEASYPSLLTCVLFMIGGR